MDENQTTCPLSPVEFPGPDCHAQKLGLCPWEHPEVSSQPLFEANHSAPLYADLAWCTKASGFVGKGVQESWPPDLSLFLCVHRAHACPLVAASSLPSRTRARPQGCWRAYFRAAGTGQALNSCALCTSPVCQERWPWAHSPATLNSATPRTS